MSTTTPSRPSPAPSSARRASIGVALACGLALVSCYNPTIVDGGLACAAVTKKCPSGYTCGFDDRCWTHPPPAPMDGGGDGDARDATDGVTDAADACATPVAPTCADPPRSGQACNPACQTGCPCGQRCNVVGKAPACVAPGTVKLGDLCKYGANDNCAPGLICRREACGNGLARCYQICTSKDQCGGGFCQLAIDDDTGNATGYDVCDIAARTCDPVASMGCPDPAFACYLAGSDTLCDCPSNPTKPGQSGDDCTFYNDCAGGLVCVAAGGSATSRCHFVCSIANASCPNRSDGGGVANCVPFGTNAKFGYCDN